MNRADLSDVVLDLTGRAVRDAPLVLHDAVPDVLARVFSFDAAWWGWCFLDAAAPAIIRSRTRGLGAGYVDRALGQLASDPVLRRLRQAPLSTMAMSTAAVPPNTPTAQLVRDFDIAEVLTGQAQLEAGAFRCFVSLYRRAGGAAFSGEDATDLRLLMQHLKQVLALSLRLDLAARLPEGAAWALVDRAGTRFLSAAGAERAQGSMREEDYSNELRLRVTEVAPAALGAREAEAARLYAEGLSARQVAGRLGRAHGTVRNQIAAAYRKTGCRDRVSLGRALRAGRGL